MHNTQKKQNKILLVSLVIILTAAAILVAITGSANRKNPTENPPLDNRTEDEGSEDTSTTEPVVIPEKITSNEDETSGGEQDTKDQKTDAEIESSEEDKEVSSILDNTLPVFSSTRTGKLKPVPRKFFEVSGISLRSPFS